MKTKRVLHVVSAMNRGGAETLLMNVYRNIDRTKIQFDFVSHRNENCDYDDEIMSLGGRIFRIQSLGQAGPFAYIKELIRIMSADQYLAVHAHTDYQSGFPVLAAKTHGIERRICHSHSNSWVRGYNVKEKLTLKVLQTIIKYSATDYCACSVEAARFLYGQQLVDRGQVCLLKNGIDIGQFVHLDGDGRLSLRHELHISQDAKIIGHVGTFSESKNQIFLLKVLKRVLDEDMNVVAVLVGEGPLKTSIEEEAKKWGLSNNIRFLGMRTDIPRLMKEFDVFLFPSLFEGFGIVALEAQSSGTPCVVADTVPKSTDMGLGLISYVSLQDNLEKWSKEIQSAFLAERPEKGKIVNRISELGFDIKRSIHHWLSLYGLENESYL